MQVRRVLVVLGVIVTALAAGAARPARAARRDLAAFDKAVEEELARVSPEAVPLWRQANAERAAGRHQAAADLYAQVLDRAPRFAHALRRRCGELGELGKHAEAREECAAALELARSPENLVTLAFAMARDPALAGDDAMEALALADEAIRAAPEDEAILMIACDVAGMREDAAAFRRCTGLLARVRPESIQGNMLLAMAAAMDGDRSAAQGYIEKARAAGLPDDAAERYSRELGIVEERGGGGAWRWLGFAGIAGAIWLGSLALLFVAGLLLSALALRAANKGPDGRSAHASAGERRLRRIYAWVIRVSGAYFYLSVPFMLAAVVLLGGGLIVGVVATGHIPIKLVLVLGIMIVMTVVAILRSLFVRADDSDPGVGLDTATQPRLRGVLEEVAGKIGTRPVDAVYLTPGTQIAVMERGGLAKQLSGRTRRCLILGVGVLDGMKVTELKSVLAHEYGHLRNEDTAGGGFALAARASMITMLVRMARSGVGTWYNPAWWFLRGFYNVFLRVTQGASRLQEVLADRWAALAYGSAAFERGYVHVVSRSVRFDAHVDATLNEVVDQKRPLPNLYRYQPAAAADPAAERTLGEAIEQAMEREPHAFDSHPAPRQRLAWVRALAAPGTPSPDDEREAWSLFEDREAIEQRLTREVREAVAVNHGIVVSAA
jgi:Zn-dependent protease with chaperone function